VRAFSGRNVYAFAGSVKRACTVPFDYLHLNYP